MHPEFFSCWRQNGMLVGATQLCNYLYWRCNITHIFLLIWITIFHIFTEQWFAYFQIPKIVFYIFQFVQYRIIITNQHCAINNNIIPTFLLFGWIISYDSKQLSKINKLPWKIYSQKFHKKGLPLLQN